MSDSNIAWSAMTIAGLTAIVSAAYNFLRKGQLDAQLENQKSSLNKELELYKSKLNKELEGVKGKQTAEIEVLRNRLAQRSSALDELRRRRLAAKESFLQAVSPLIGSIGMEHYSGYTDVDDVSWELESERLPPIAFQLVEWLHANRVFLPEEAREESDAKIRADLAFASEIARIPLYENQVDSRGIEQLYTALHSAADHTLGVLDAAIAHTTIGSKGNLE